MTLHNSSTSLIIAKSIQDVISIERNKEAIDKWLRMLDDGLKFLINIFPGPVDVLTHDWKLLSSDSNTLSLTSAKENLMRLKTLKKNNIVKRKSSQPQDFSQSADQAHIMQYELIEKTHITEVVKTTHKSLIHRNTK